MASADSVLLLALFLVAAIMYFIGLGWLITGFALHGSLIHRKINASRLQEFAIILLVGMILNYGLIMIFQRLMTSLIIGISLSLFGLTAYFIYLHNQHIILKPANSTIAAILGTITMLMLIISPIIVEPLENWDARSIWFLHAKMIYSAGTIGPPADWLNPAVSWSHPEYPKFIPALAGQTAFIFEFWNEYLPKLALFLTLIPGVILFLGNAQKKISFILLFLMIPFSFFPYVWDGYMDGILAFYFAIALLLIAKYHKSNNPIDLFSALTCTVLLVLLKNEGMLAGISLIVATVVYLLINRTDFSLNQKNNNHWRYILATGILLIPFFAWLYYQTRWNLQSDLNLGTRESIIHIFSRLTDGSWKTIIKTEYREISINVLIVVLVFLAATRWKIYAIKEALPVIMAAGVYFLGITVIYLLTPRNLTWHLNTSVGRTMMLVNAALIVTWYIFITKIEHHDENKKNHYLGVSSNIHHS